MTSKILFIILMSAFFFVPMFLHRSRRQFMTRFYLRMTALVAARKLYRLMLLILLYVFHFLYICVHYNDIGVVASPLRSPCSLSLWMWRGGYSVCTRSGHHSASLRWRQWCLPSLLICSRLRSPSPLSFWQHCSIPRA